eukprot:CAMPEP_0118637882 /NCGR_PEP_ID=MMETSP0785-20121206/3387_1 /TAXON_ID=91992 /ORGANISM="Bolidomonas pacifica, Strain CCMP 1866" /LENGTH=1359 /DNA_ID=CAMNT_0006529093 /DNA_START=929 /DNA_END=5008 /DNA_ORIENTATION=-
MVRLKVLSTFFQVSELTTLIDIPWPKFVLMTLPFQFPTSDARCLAAGVGWNLQHTVYASIYIPLLIFLVLLFRARRSPAGSVKRFKAASTLIFLCSLYYSPGLRTIASVFGCVEDHKGDWVVIADPTLSCETSSSRTLMLLQGIAFATLVGVGFPLFVALKALQLKRNNALDAHASISSLYENYTPDMPWFESVQMLRKALLILAGTFIPNPLFQAILFVVINLSFLIVLGITRPLVYFPCSVFKRDLNLFFLAEFSSALIPILGSSLAVIGSFSQDAVKNIGIAFSVTNLTFAVCFATAYSLEMRKTALVKKKITEYVGEGTEEISKSVVDAMREFKDLTYLIKAANDERTKQKLVSGLAFLHSKVIKTIRIELNSMNGSKINVEQFERMESLEGFCKNLEEEMEQHHEVSKGLVQKVFWSWAISNSILDNIAEQVESNFGKEQDFYTQIVASKSWEGEKQTIEELIKDYKTGTGWVTRQGVKILDFIDTQLVGRGLNHCLIAKARKLIEEDVLEDEHSDDDEGLIAAEREQIVIRMHLLPFTSDVISLAETFEEVSGIDKVEGRCSMAETRVKVRGDGIGKGAVICQVKGRFEDVAAYFWENLEGEVEKEKEGFNRLVRRRYLVGKGKEFEFYSTYKLHFVKKDVVQISGDMAKKGEKGTWSPRERFTIDCEKVGEKKTKVDMVVELDLGENTGKATINEYLKDLLGKVSEAAYHFGNLLRGSEVTEEDAKLIAENLMRKIKERKKGESKEEVVKGFVMENTALRELLKKYSFQRELKVLENIVDNAIVEVVRGFDFNSIEPLLVAVVEGKLRKAGEVKADARSMVAKEGEMVGGALAIKMATTLTSSHAVDEWRLQYPALQEVMSESVWVKPMLEAVAFKLMGEVRWGLKARVVIGAFTSMLDLATDIYVTNMFYKNKSFRYFEASVASLGISLCLKMFVVFLQYRKLGSTRVLLETFPVLIGFKPALDAYRVAKGQKQEAETEADHMFEMTVIKCIEVFAEAIPGVIVQLLAIANVGEGKEVASGVWISLAVSAFSTGLISASISYDFDTDPKSRKMNPFFYGYLPGKASDRSIVFISMIFFSGGMLLIRCTTIVLLALLGRRWAFAYIGVDLGLYFLVKILRGDFWYWVPAGGAIEIVFSIFARFLVKIINDFTSIVQFRHPNEVGGMYWTFGFVLTMGSLPAAIKIYEGQGGDQLVANFAWRLLCVLIPITLTVFLIFLFHIEKKYRHTFISTLRGKDLTIMRFRSVSDDWGRADAIFMNTKRFWSDIADEVKVWVGANWNRWEDEKPTWLDAAMRARIPLDFIPTAEGRKKEKGRRVSVLKVEAQRRASVRRSSILGKLPKVAPESETESET